MKSILFLTTAFLILFSAECRADTRELVIGGIPEAPLRFFDEKGAMTGIDIDIVRHIMEKLQVPCRVELIDSSARLERMWKEDAALDMVFTYSFKQWRTRYLIYPKESHIKTEFHFFILKSNQGKIRFNTFADLKGLTVGMTSGFSYTPEFLEAAESGLFRISLLPVNSLHMKMLLKGRIDTVPLPSSVALYEATQNGYRDQITYLPKAMKSKPYFNTFVKTSDFPGLEDMITPYDRELKQMKEDGSLKAVFLKYGIE